MELKRVLPNPYLCYNRKNTMRLRDPFLLKLPRIHRRTYIKGKTKTKQLLIILLMTSGCTVGRGFLLGRALPKLLSCMQHELCLKQLIRIHIGEPTWLSFSPINPSMRDALSWLQKGVLGKEDTKYDIVPEMTQSCAMSLVHDSEGYPWIIMN